MHKGYELFMTAPGEADAMACAVCGAHCTVKRNVLGPTSWAGAMAKMRTLHDTFQCPNAGREWHDDALALVQAIGGTPSPRVAALMKQDLKELLSKHGAPGADVAKTD